MKRLIPGKNAHVAAPEGGRVACRVVAVAGPWALLSVADPSAALPDWLDREVYLVFFEGAHPVQLRGRAEPGRLQGELRFAASAGVGHPEPRTTPRVPMSTVAMILGPAGELLECGVVDLGAGGMRVRHHGRFVAGDRARVQFKLPDGPRVDADVVVREVAAGTSALVFVHFHSGCTQSVAEWCVDELRRRTPGAGRPAPRADQSVRTHVF